MPGWGEARGPGGYGSGGPVAPTPLPPPVPSINDFLNEPKRVKIPRPRLHKLTLQPITGAALEYTCSDCPMTILEVDWFGIAGSSLDDVGNMAQAEHRKQMGVTP